MSVYRIFVEKKPAYAVASEELREDLRSALGIELHELHLLNRYDLENLSEETFSYACRTILSEPQVDDTYPACPYEELRVFAVEYLPGQFDQRADSCAQCISLATAQERPLVRTARVYAIDRSVSDQDFERIKQYLINPVESREASLARPDTLKVAYEIPTSVKTLEGFTALDEAGLHAFLDEYALAMDPDDVCFCQQYFRETERRDPTITEIRMIDTYWSDHCRHTTFSTEIGKVSIESPYIKESFEHYLRLRESLGRQEKPMTLMDLATIGAKALRAQGVLNDLDESEEINACSVKIKVDVDGEQQDWLLMFKNETHNHPTEIEPFGGAATCLGGAIRDPLSGRSYVYQAMRVTGAGDPLVPIEETLPGKLPQRKIVTTAAAGYSSYGNQIGLATGLVHEIYHPGYVAKRMEIGAVVGAAPCENVRRSRPQAGDVVLLLGGKTGRDGCGGATGSSKVHTLSSLTTCTAEVQKGNPPEERKLQRLFRNPEATRLIKRCNDFGAGGVSVAIGELADGLQINLNAVPQKYDGLDGTELAISESQERMAVVVSVEDAAAFTRLASEENLAAVQVAVVTEAPRLSMEWNGKRIVDLSREFLNSNGAKKHTDIEVASPAGRPEPELPAGDSLEEKLSSFMSDLRRCSQKGLCERFDSTIGAGSVLMPFGGRYQLTPAQAMAAKIPLLRGETTTCSLMAFGYDPDVAVRSPYHSAMLAVIESVAKVVAAGGDYRHCWLTFQEYFERTKGDPKRWGKPMAALLGALEAQIRLGIASIGGKDSMSGSFEEIDVPPTLVSFAVSVGNTRRIPSPEFKGAGNNVYLLAPRYDENGLPDFESVRAVFDKMQSLIQAGRARSVWAITGGGMLEGLCKMALGNRIGFRAAEGLTMERLLSPLFGGFLFECEGSVKHAELLGVTEREYRFTLGGEKADLLTVQAAYEGKLAPVFPYLTPNGKGEVERYAYDCQRSVSPKVGIARPKVVVPVFPGTNCEYDTARAFERAGAEAQIVVLRNLSPRDIEESVQQMVRAIEGSQIIALPGGFSGGDEPDGSAKFIVSFFRNPAITEAVHGLLDQRDGLMLGICNGFQALIKLGLLPFGHIQDVDDSCPTLTYNTICRHQSMLVRTRVVTNRSPWLMKCQPDDVHTIAVSHGEGRFIASGGMLERLAENGQIATQYVDLDGNPTMDIRFNPNGSYAAIEGITSPDGRIYGKMGHTERGANDLFQNVTGFKDQPIFAGAVEYFHI
ncbi:phosphoribosylformylglycinamidine synthase [Harryflintia acetispora]|uniref:phosphoribosylformylglycinamidine synthase n=1 Tax=Harryflintia acetispora TaxID=1849041 RepID=UPI00189A07C0|nr:phosphoribosylformylglycinamidine synthase [Harryflintia acetispora]